MEQFWHAFLPLCVAFDGIGLLPLFWALAQRLSPRQRQRAVVEAVGTAWLVAVGFLLVSRFVFALMGLAFADIMVAGGSILFVLCLRDLLLPEKPPRASASSPGVVPLGVPLLAGPAVLTTVLLVRDRYGWLVTLIALSANMGVIWVMLRSSEWLMRRLGRDGAQVISKISSLILTAFGVMLIRHGILLATGGALP
ncbi:MAG: MarC family protein [Candidatus Omnitrophica bacterium]|nr:MarC family protein [Candidatus Omnitrophota bacterium]